MTREDRVAHLLGYAVIAAILGTSTWASRTGTLVAGVFAAAAGLYATGNLDLATEGADDAADETLALADPSADPQRGEA